MKKITSAQLKAAQTIFDKLEGWKLARKTLNYFFKKFPNNDDEKIVLAKVCLIDHLYGTNTKNPVGVSQHIVKQRIDVLLRRKNDNRAALEAINKIVKWEKEILSFGSKYCHFHNKAMFPIYDKYASVALSILADGDDWTKNCRNYSLYRNKITEVFRGFSFEKTDVYLWLYGLRKVLRDGRKDVNKEVRNIFDDKPELFEALD